MKQRMSEAGTIAKAKSKIAAKGSAKAKHEPRPRGGAARSVADMLPDVGRAAFRRFGFVQSSVVSRWAEIVGERYARVSVPESIRFPQGRRADGVLTLTVEGAHGTMLQFGAAGRSSLRDRALTQPAQSAAIRVDPAPLMIAAKNTLTVTAGAQIYTSVFRAEQARDSVVTVATTRLAVGYN